MAEARITVLPWLNVEDKEDSSKFFMPEIWIQDAIKILKSFAFLLSLFHLHERKRMHGVITYALVHVSMQARKAHTHVYTLM